MKSVKSSDGQLTFRLIEISNGPQPNNNEIISYALKEGAVYSVILSSLNLKSLNKGRKAFTEMLKKSTYIDQDELFQMSVQKAKVDSTNDPKFEQEFAKSFTPMQSALLKCAKDADVGKTVEVILSVKSSGTVGGVVHKKSSKIGACIKEILTNQPVSLKPKINTYNVHYKTKIRKS